MRYLVLNQYVDTADEAVRMAMHQVAINTKEFNRCVSELKKGNVITIIEGKVKVVVSPCGNLNI